MMKKPPTRLKNSCPYVGVMGDCHTPNLRDSRSKLGSEQTCLVRQSGRLWLVVLDCSGVVQAIETNTNSQASSFLRKESELGLNPLGLVQFALIFAGFVCCAFLIVFFIASSLLLQSFSFVFHCVLLV